MAQASLKESTVTLKLQSPFELYNLNSAPPAVVTTNKAELIKLFEEMWRVRRMEMAADALYKGKLIRGFCHLGIGQVNKIEYINVNISLSLYIYLSLFLSRSISQFLL